MQTIIRGQQSGRLIFFVEDFMDVDHVVYAPFEEWLLADRKTDDLPMSCVKSTDINPETDDLAEFRRRCIRWLRRKNHNDYPAVAVLATGTDNG